MVAPTSATFRNLAQTTTSAETVNSGTTEPTEENCPALTVDMNGIVHVAWKTRPAESPANRVLVRDGLIGVGWDATSGIFDLTGTTIMKTPVSLTAMGNGDAYAFFVAQSSSKRDAVYYAKYTAPTAYGAFGSWATAVATSDLAMNRSQAIWTPRLNPRGRTDTMWFLANDSEHKISTSYTDRLAGTAGWSPPAVTSTGFHPQYVYSFPKTNVDLGTMPLAVVSQTSQGAVYVVDQSTTPHLYAIDRPYGFLARSYTPTGSSAAQYVIATTYSGNVHLLAWTLSNSILKLVDTGSALSFDTAWTNNPKIAHNAGISQPPFFNLEGGTRYVYLAQRQNPAGVGDDGRIFKLYAENGNTLANDTTDKVLSTWKEPVSRFLNDQVFYAHNAGGLLRFDADLTGLTTTSAALGRVKHPILVRDNNNLFVAPEDNAVWRLSASLATSTWTSGQSFILASDKTSGASYTSSATNTIFVGVNNILYRLNAANGNLVANWPQPSAGNIVTLPVEWKTYVYFGTDVGQLFAVNRTSNIARANWPITLDTTNGTPVVRSVALDAVSSAVYFTTNEGRLYKFRIE